MIERRRHLPVHIRTKGTYTETFFILPRARNLVFDPHQVHGRLMRRLVTLTYIKISGALYWYQVPIEKRNNANDRRTK